MEPVTYTLTEEDLKMLVIAIDRFNNPMVVYSDNFETMRKSADEKRKMAMDMVNEVVDKYRFHPKMPSL
ncbi:MAG: hypothetical protein IMZ70_00410 [Candidatus Atribacteria bacterium]|nr:hypothetical protein [Candidatus Atribacteria bacterium]MBE3140094.1 hypothetical protein [Thermoplasmata archaeon]